MKFTPAPARKVGRPAYKFLCEVCKERKRTENELKSHMKTMHAPGKRTLTEMRQGQIQRAASMKLSPPKKKLNLNKTVRNIELEKRGQEIENLKLKKCNPCRNGGKKARTTNKAGKHYW